MRGWLLCILLTMVGGQPYMPIYDEVNVMSTATLHLATINHYDFEHRVWRVNLTFDRPFPPGFTYAVFVLDQRNATGPSYNFLTDVAPWCAPAEMYCCHDRFVHTTRYFNDDLTGALRDLPPCEQNLDPWQLLLSNLTAFPGIRSGEGAWFDYSKGVLNFPHAFAQTYGLEYLDQSGNYVIDFRLLAVFQGMNDGFLEINWVPYQSVLLRNIDDILSRSSSDVQYCVGLNRFKPEESFWLARYVSPNSTERICQWFCDRGLYSFPLHAQQTQAWLGDDAVRDTVCRAPPSKGVAVGFTLWLLINSTVISEVLGTPVNPRYLTMETAGGVGYWLDTLASNLTRAISDAIVLVRGIRTSATTLTELHNTRYAREWRVYMQTSRKLYEAFRPSEVTPGIETAFVKDSRASPYEFPEWLKRMGVIDKEQDMVVSAVPLERRQGTVMPVDSISIEAVSMIESEFLKVEDVVQAVVEGVVNLIQSKQVDGLWGVDVYLREMTARVQDKPSRVKDFEVSFTILAYVAAGTLAVLLTVVLLRCQQEDSYSELTDGD